MRAINDIKSVLILTSFHRFEVYDKCVRRHNDGFNIHIGTNTFKPLHYAIMDTVDPDQPRTRYPYNAIAYLISSAGAKAYIDLIDK